MNERDEGLEDRTQGPGADDPQGEEEEAGGSEGVRFTERRLDIMSHLWKHGSGTVAEVREAMPGDPGYTTVLKMLQVLEEQGHVRHEPEGRAYRYYPTVEAEQAGRGHLATVVDKIFQGSVALTVAQLLSSRRVPPEELDRLRALLEEAEGATEPADDDRAADDQSPDAPDEPPEGGAAPR